MNAQIEAGRACSAWIVFISAIIFGITFDLSTKNWAFKTIAGEPVILNKESLLQDLNLNPIPPHNGIIAVPWNLLDFRLVLNSGAVFGLGSNQRPLLLFLTTIAITIAIWAFAFHLKEKQHLAQISLGFVVAGGIGNLYDRLIYGRVRDFLHLFPTRELPWGLQWPGGSPELFPWIFNIADVLLIIGMIILLITTNKNNHTFSELNTANT